MLIDDAVTEVLDRLADTENQIWSRDEIKAYYQDGLDMFCRRTKCLWDIHVIENLPPVGNWQTDLEKYIADHTPGLSTTDERLIFTADDEKSKPLGGGAYAGHRGPIQAVITKPSDRTYLSSYSNLTVDAGKKVVGGTLPTSTVEVSRVSYDQRTLAGMTSARMKELDPRYETRAGEPNYYVFDKDGLYFLRVVPAAQASASYDTVSGSWGTLTQRLDSDSAVEDTIADTGTGGYGILRYRADCFPAGGPNGTPTRIHPDSLNIKVEMFRLNRDTTSNEVELPVAYQKYPVFWAMHKALERTGSGQAQQLSDHYKSRFELGVQRMEEKVREMDKERIGRLGGVTRQHNFALGEPIPPYPYGIPY